jgi:hypothetical protein
MNPFEMVAVIVIVVMIARVLRDRYRYGASNQTLQPPVIDADSERLRDEVARLRERVQVLERVITDNHSSSDLDRQIERLRDPQ